MCISKIMHKPFTHIRKNVFTWNRKTSIVFILIILVTLSIYFNYKKSYVLYYSNVYNLVLTYQKNRSNYTIAKPGEYACSPIVTNKVNYEYFKVNIDGVEYPKIIPLYQNKSIDFKCLNTSNQTKTILMWNKFIGLPIVDYGFGKSEIFEKLKCPVTNCELTNNKSKLLDSDLILFHLRSVMPEFPPIRLAHQRWVHVIFESPAHCSQCDKYENVFNLSVTYTRDSDFTSIYLTDSGLYWDKPNKNTNQTNIYSTKTNFAAALVSYCAARSPRLNFIQSLQKYIPVTIFGKCGEACPSSVDCREYISKHYKFFFAFENSFCRDYVTEKFLETLRYDIIPVVFGDGNYEDYAPKSGYINVQDYKTAKNLANYLLYLDKNQTAYNEYFIWKKYLRYDPLHPIGGYLCEMCIKLHLESYTGQYQKKQFNSLHSHFGLNENCRDLQVNGDDYKLVPAQDATYANYINE